MDIDDLEVSHDIVLIKKEKEKGVQGQMIHCPTKSDSGFYKIRKLGTNVLGPKPDTKVVVDPSKIVSVMIDGEELLFVETKFILAIL